MLRINKFSMLSLMAISLTVTSCDKDDDDDNDNFDTSGTYTQNDQMARPAINTVFVGSARKNEFNTTVPSAMNAAFNAQFQTVLTNFGYTTNALGMDKATFAGALVTDVLNVKTNGTTTLTVDLDGVAAGTTAHQVQLNGVDLSNGGQKDNNQIIDDMVHQQNKVQVG